MSLFSKIENSKRNLSLEGNQMGLTQKQRELLYQEKKQLLEENKRLKKGVLGKIWLVVIVGCILFLWIGKKADLILFTILGAICFFLIVIIPIIGFFNLGAKGTQEERNKKRLEEIEFQLAGR